MRDSLGLTFCALKKRKRPSGAIFSAIVYVTHAKAVQQTCASEMARAISVESFYVVASGGVDGPRWHLHFNAEAGRRPAGGYVLDARQAWRLLLTLSNFLADYHCHEIFRQSPISSDRSSDARGSSAPIASGSG